MECEANFIYKLDPDNILENIDDNPSREYNLKTKCAEIFITKSRQLVSVCVICEKNYEDFQEFCDHIIAKHLTNQFSNSNNNQVEYLDIGETAAISCQFCSIDLKYQNKDCVHSKLHGEQIIESELDQSNRRDKLEISNQRSYNNKKKLKDPLSKSLKDNFVNDDDNKKNHLYCKFCEKLFRDPVKFLHHMDQVHGNEKEETTLRATTKCRLSDRKKIESHQIKSKESRKRFSKEVTVKQQNDEYKSKPYKCILCAKYFKYYNRLRIHRIHYHETHKIVQCKKCTKYFVNREKLKNHRKFPCSKIEQCSVVPKKDDGRSKKAKNHIKPLKLEIIQVDLYCHVCDITFQRRGAYEIHMEVHNTDLHKDIEASNICKYCLNDLNTENPNCKRTTEHGEKLHKCRFPGCKTGFNSMRKRETHEKSHFQKTSDAGNNNFDTGKVALYCDICQKPFVRRIKFLQHMEKHNSDENASNETSYKCDKCDHPEFLNKWKLDLHIRTLHKVNKVFKNKPEKVEDDAEIDISDLSCAICKLSFKRPFYYRRHMKLHNANKCTSNTNESTTCNYCLIDLSTKNSKCKQSRNHGEKRYKCRFPACGTSFKVRFGRETHEKLHFEKVTTDMIESGTVFNNDFTCGKVSLFCNICRKPFQTGPKFLHHMERHKLFPEKQYCEEKVEKEENEEDDLEKDDDSEEPKICHFCSIDIKLESPECRHARRHGEKIFKCRYTDCDKLFKSLDTRTAHEWRAHEPIAEECKFKCPIAGCERTFRSKAGLSAHKPTHSKQAFKCTQCNHPEFPTKGKLTLHIKVIHRDPKDNPFKCNYCQKSFLYKHYYTDHLNTHTGDRPHKCPICPAAFAFYNALRTHRYNMHTAGTQVQCEQCGEYLKNRIKLRIHKEVHHKDKNLRPFKCDVCEKAFFKRSLLEQHQNIHKGIKPFHCKICLKTFVGQKPLRQHEKVHQEASQHPCTECNKIFRHSSSLSAHRKTHLAAKYYQL